MSVVIIDYGMGNIASVQKALNFLKIENIVSNDKKAIEDSKVLILPGVGTFKQGMENLHNLGLVDVLNTEVIEKKKPFLGFCLGMQLLATLGTEVAETEGLNWVKGIVKKIEEPGKRIPHLGWNQISIQKKSFLSDLDNKDFYFIHSYHFDIEDKSEIAATVNYGNNYVAAIQKENIFATQFHPEKSQQSGLKLLETIFNHYAEGTSNTYPHI